MDKEEIQIKMCLDILEVHCEYHSKCYDLLNNVVSKTYYSSPDDDSLVDSFNKDELKVYLLLGLIANVLTKNDIAPHIFLLKIIEFLEEHGVKALSKKPLQSSKLRVFNKS